MKLVFIYGPPGVGKLTVARELSRATGFPLLHNHLTFDVMHSMLAVEHKLFWKELSKLRSSLLRVAIKARLPGLIVTSVYAKGDDDADIRRKMRLVKNGGGRILFARLHCHHRELHGRVKHPSRKKYKKIRTLAMLRKLMCKHDLTSAIPFVRSFTVDNTHISPARCARMIAKHYKLPLKRNK